MSDFGFVGCKAAVITGVMLVFANTGLLADEEAESEESSDEVTEEIVVYGPRRGDKIDVDAIYEELIRSNLIKELIRTQALEEENKWRLSLSGDQSPSRIKWGYDLDAELRIRRNSELTDLPIDDTKPATLFRYEF